ncbi:MAG: CpaF family protein, partial [Peptococcaceae bacterium]|nr:CpaF family protein [Peptococcaceae bacterium]
MSLFARFEQKSRKTLEPDGVIQVNKRIQPARQVSSAPPKDPFQDLKIDLHKKVIAELADLPQEKRDRREPVAERIGELVGRLIDESGQHVSRSDRQRIISEIIDEAIGFGPITSLLKDPEVTEIMVNGPRQVYVERGGRLELTPITFRDDQHVMHVIEKIVAPLGRRIDESSPMVDARLPDGSRVNAIIPPLVLNGPAITIRKFFQDPLTVENLLSLGTLTEEMALFLEACVRARLNMIVSGGTGSGKTSMLNILSSFIPADERIITIEDAAELQLRQEHVVTLESRPANMEGRGEVTIRDLVRNALRMRPDRIIVGEVRSGEALDMLQAMNTGHDGSLPTG